MALTARYNGEHVSIIQGNTESLQFLQNELKDGGDSLANMKVSCEIFNGKTRKQIIQVLLEDIEFIHKEQ